MLCTVGLAEVKKNFNDLFISSKVNQSLLSCEIFRLSVKDPLKDLSDDPLKDLSDDPLNDPSKAQSRTSSMLVTKSKVKESYKKI